MPRLASAVVLVRWRGRSRFTGIYCRGADLVGASAPAVPDALPLRSAPADLVQLRGRFFTLVCGFASAEIWRAVCSLRRGVCSACLGLGYDRGRAVTSLCGGLPVRLTGCGCCLLRLVCSRCGLRVRGGVLS